MIAVVTGGRDNYDVPTVEGVLGDFGPFAALYHGGATGVDSVAYAFAFARGVPIRAFPADWEQHGRAAGPIRNRQMLLAAQEEAERLGVRVTLFAFNGGRGTANCVAQAKELGIKVVDTREEARDGK